MVFEYVGNIPVWVTPCSFFWGIGSFPAIDESLIDSFPS